MTDEIKCPRCGSTQVAAGEKGFGLGKAAVGGLLLGPVGLLGGVIGSKAVKIACLNCGWRWKPQYNPHNTTVIHHESSTQTYQIPEKSISDSSESSDSEDRIPCSDDSCTGIIGANGKCGYCGKPMTKD
jgi:hypothetical protein